MKNEQVIKNQSFEFEAVYKLTKNLVGVLYGTGIFNQYNMYNVSVCH